MVMEVQPCVIIVAARSSGVGGEDEVPLVGYMLLECATHHPSFLLDIITIIINANFSK
jgi:hypothetical protein